MKKTNSTFFTAISIIVFFCMPLLSLGQGICISQYIETNSGTTPKGVEIWNNSDSDIDFSVEKLTIKKGTNGNLPAEDVLISSGVLSKGAVWVIGSSDIGDYLTIQSLGVANYTEKTFTFNGDDALELWIGDNKMDVFGQPGVDPGSEWTGNGVSTKNQNIAIRNTVVSGAAEGWSDPSVRFETVSTDNSLTGFGVSPTTNVLDEPANHVVNFVASVNSHKQIILSWLDNDGAQVADGFLIVGKTLSGTYTQVIDGSDLVEDLDWSDNNFNVKVAHGVETYTVEDLNVDQAYNFMIYPYTNSGTNIDYKTDATVPVVSATTQPAPSQPVLLISEIVDPSDQYKARYVEIYNPTEMAIDLTDVYLQKQSNGVNFSGINLTGTIQPKGKYVCAYAQADFNAAYGFDPDIASGNINGNGDDAYILRYGGADGEIIDIYGVLNQNGTGELWAYEDCQVVRKRNVTAGTATWSADEWVIISEASAVVMTPAEHAEDKVWSGATDVNWNTKTNWEAINERQFLPDASSNITIPPAATNALVIDNNHIIYNNLKAKGADKLKVNPTKSLEVLGHVESTNPANLLLKSDATGSAVLLHNTDNVQATVQVHYADLGKWYYVGSPISNATSNVYLGDYLYFWDEATTNWVNIVATTEPLNVTQGYAMQKQTNNAVAYAGILNNGNISSVNITNTGSSNNPNQDGWNLLSNPYPSVIDVEQFTYPSGITAGASVFNHTTESYIAYSAGGGGNEEARYIQPGQAFLIKSSSSAAQTLPFTNALRTATNVAPMDKAIQESLKLSLHKDNAQIDETYISFREGATIGYDTYYDMYKMASPHAHLFSYLPDTTAGKLAINSIPNAQALDFIPLGIAVEAGTYTIRVAQMDSFDENENFYLHDKTTNKHINLRESSTYVFEVEQSDDINRFDLTFSKPLGINDDVNEKRAFYIYTSANNLFIRTTQANATETAVVVYDVLGQIVYKNEHYILNTPIALGTKQTYVLNIMSSAGNSSQHKVILK